MHGTVKGQILNINDHKLLIVNYSANTKLESLIIDAYLQHLHLLNG